MTSLDAPPSSSRGRGRLWLLLAVVLVGAAAGGGWMWLSHQQALARDAAAKARVEAEARAAAEAMMTRSGERDCAACPEMLRVEPGSFTMGNPSASAASFDGPPQSITFALPFRLAKFEVTRAEFTAFVEATGYIRPRDSQVPDTPTDLWRRPGFEQTDRHPVVNLSLEDADAYVAWLAKTTGKNYRLPSEAEWEYAARAGTTANVHWGDLTTAQACRYANLADLDYGEAMRAAAAGADQSDAAGGTVIGVIAADLTFPCHDGYVNTAPVGSFPANPWGFHDMIGNVSEWTQGCWADSLAGTPPDGTPRLAGDCYARAMRGEGFVTESNFLGAAVRSRVMMGDYGPWMGFRVARDE
jgi:formylglycine-generating enzyme required for sulfatase activity